MRIHEAIAKDAGLRGELKCEICGHREPVGEREAARYLARGWPKCCEGLTMTLTRSDAGGSR